MKRIETEGVHVKGRERKIYMKKKRNGIKGHKIKSKDRKEEEKSMKAWTMLVTEKKQTNESEVGQQK